MRALLLSLACLAGCRAVPDTSELHEVAARGGFTVHAATAEQAEHVLGLLEQVLPAVRELPGLREPSALEVFVPRTGARDTRGSTKWRGRERLRAAKWLELELGADARAQRYLVGHELVHGLLDETWLALPCVLEEGLADHGGDLAEPGHAPVRRLTHATWLASWAANGLLLGGDTLRFDLDLELLPGIEELLRLDRRGFERLRPASQRDFGYALGYLLVERIGVEELRRACERARAAGRAALASAEILALARLDAREREGWRAALLELAEPARP